MPGSRAFTILVDEPDSGKRLDLFVASRVSACSRSFAASLIRNGTIQVQGESKKPGYKVRAGEEVCGYIPPPEPVSYLPEPIEIDILHEDEHLIVVNKQPGIVVHPAPGHYTGTLVNGLLHHCPELEGIGGELRPGIVHRLDKDTSGALVAAKNDAAHRNLALQFKSRRIKKEYLALVHGALKPESGVISLPMGRHPVDRKKMSIRSRKSRSAKTSWRVKQHFAGVTLIELDLKTGRTHQIRVHCAALNHPIVGDAVYGGRKAGKKISIGEDQFLSVSRQMLHAWRLGFMHPATEKFVIFEAPMAQDMRDLISALDQVTQDTSNHE